MPNCWVEYVKEYASKNGMSYRDALRCPKCKAGYKHREKDGEGLGQSKSKVAPTMEEMRRNPMNIVVEPNIPIEHRHIDRPVEVMPESQANQILSGKAGVRGRKYRNTGRGIIDESNFADQRLLAIKYNDSELGANAGKKYISL